MPEVILRTYVLQQPRNIPGATLLLPHFGSVAMIPEHLQFGASVDRTRPDRREFAHSAIAFGRCNRTQVGGESPRDTRANYETLASSGTDHFRPLLVREPFTTQAS